MSDFEVISSVEVRTRIGEYLNRVRLRREVIGISQHRQVVAVLVPIEEWRALTATASQATPN